MQEKAKKLKEVRRICCEEAIQARHARNEELSMQHQRHPFDCVSDDDSNSGFIEQSDSLNDTREFTILNQGAALERHPFLVEPLLF